MCDNPKHIWKVQTRTIIRRSNKGKQINHNGGEIIEYIIPVQSDVALSSCTTVSGVSAGLLSPGGGRRAWFANSEFQAPISGTFGLGIPFRNSCPDIKTDATSINTTIEIILQADNNSIFSTCTNSLTASYLISSRNREELLCILRYVSHNPAWPVLFGPAPTLTKLRVDSFQTDPVV